MAARAAERDLVTALGLMSGTSMDGIDAAVVTTDGVRIAATGPWATYPYATDLRARLAAVVADPTAADPATMRALETALTDAHADAVVTLLRESGPAADAVSVVGFHGHTVLHRPERRLTRQIADGARLAAAIGLDVVNDFRAADVAAGGQGAPFASLYHRALADGLERPLAVLNLGGVGNVTYLDDGEDGTAIAFDTGPANAPIDDWIARYTGEPCDRDGRHAAAGRVDRALLDRLLGHRYFDRPPPKSLDRNDFTAAAVDGLSLADGAATLTALTAGAVARGMAHLPAPPRRWLVTGGGRHNPALMTMLRDAVAAPVEPVEAVGWQGDALEAQAFGFLTVRSIRGLPLSLPTTTGVPRPMTGGTLHRAGRAA
ncbi:MAG: anhydro-N-acetylmuramic acid kinase [Alphaproteobacteria bacterium]